jgi:hypothetical protein
MEDNKDREEIKRKEWKEEEEVMVTCGKPLQTKRVNAFYCRFSSDVRNLNLCLFFT